MFTPTADALGSLGLTAAAGLLPLLVFFALLGIFKLPTYVCGAGAVAVSIVVALMYGIPGSMIAASATYGLVFGISPILLIVIAAVWLYQLTVTSGRARDVRAVFASVGKGDIRVQALLIGFSFCGLLEGLAGFGAPVAIVAAMLVSIGLPPIKAAIVTMVGNAINVGFGAMGIPTMTTARLGGESATDVAVQASLMTPLLAICVPFVLLYILDGLRGIRQLWHLALIQGIATGVGHMIAARFISFELIAVLASLLAFLVLAAALTVITPTTPEDQASDAGELPPVKNIVLGLLPYWLVVALFAVAKLWRIGIDLPALASSTDLPIEWPGLYGRLLTDQGEPSSSAIYTLQWLSSPALVIALTALIVTAVYAGMGDMRVADGFMTLGRTVREMSMAGLTICLVMILAYIMNFSGQTLAIGAALASTGAFFAVLSPVLGWLGTAVTGSATASGALFAGLQSTAALGTGVDPTLYVATNTIGSGLGKIVSPQNLAIAATAVGAKGSEPELLRKALPWSVGLLALLAIQVVLHA